MSGRLLALTVGAVLFASCGDGSSTEVDDAGASPASSEQTDTSADGPGADSSTPPSESDAPDTSPPSTTPAPPASVPTAAIELVAGLDARLGYGELDNDGYALPPVTQVTSNGDNHVIDTVGSCIRTIGPMVHQASPVDEARIESVTIDTTGDTPLVSFPTTAALAEGTSLPSRLPNAYYHQTVQLQVGPTGAPPEATVLLTYTADGGTTAALLDRAGYAIQPRAGFWAVPPQQEGLVDLRLMDVAIPAEWSVLAVEVSIKVSHQGVPVRCRTGVAAADDERLAGVLDALVRPGGTGGVIEITPTWEG